MPWMSAHHHRRPPSGLFLQALIVAALTVQAACTETAQPDARSATRPNIVIIMTDDAGYSDPGCYGGEIPTPNIDALAAGGIRFAKFYTNARCSPTRASLMTGMYPHRVGVGDLCMRRNETPFPGYKRAMSKDVVTLAEAMREAGYHTMMTGKWHLGGRLKDDADRRPRARGFDRHFGKLGGKASYFESRSYRLDGAPYVPETDHGEPFYATRAISDHAVRFVHQARAADRRPFFLYVAYTAPHAPHQAPEADLDRHRHLYRGGDWEAVRQARYRGLLREGLIDQRWAYTPLTLEQQERFDGRDWAIDQMTRVAAMSNVVDEGVGRIVGALRELGELENTLIIYLSDNGPDAFHTHVGAAPLTGSKNLLTEGGIATHCILHWPAGIRGPGRIEHRPGHVIDLMPTCLELAGGGPTPRHPGGGPTQRHPGGGPTQRHPGGGPTQYRDGRSLVPVIRNEGWAGHEVLFWELYGRQALIENARWKYLADRDGNARLYDLEADPAETVDLAQEHPETLARLSERYQSWAEANNVMPRDELETWRQANLKTEKNVSD